MVGGRVHSDVHVVQRDTGGLAQGFVDLDLGSSPRLVGRYCSYLLPKQDGGTIEKIKF